MSQRKTQPEAHASFILRKYMEAKGWKLEKLHGGLYQIGLPDFVAFHPIHGLRWIEMKDKGRKLRPAQRIKFAEWRRFSQEVYILENKGHYMKLFEKRGNWLEYV